MALQINLFLINHIISKKSVTCDQLLLTKPSQFRAVILRCQIVAWGHVHNCCASCTCIYFSFSPPCSVPVGLHYAVFNQFVFVFHPSQINAIPEQLSVNSCSTGVAASSATLGNSCLTNERSECYSAKLSALNSQEEGDQSREQELLLSRLESLWLQLQMLLEGTKTYNRSLATKFLHFSSILCSFLTIVSYVRNEEMHQPSLKPCIFHISNYAGMVLGESHPYVFIYFRIPS